MGTKGKDTPGEQLTEQYLTAKGWPFQRHPEVEGKNPDFTVETPDDGEVAVEVFEPSFEIPEGGGSFDSVTPLEALFTTNKRKQSQAARKAGMPIVMVVGSDEAPFAYNLWSVMGVMFGREGVEIPLDDAEAARSVRLGGAKVQPSCGKSVSAIALLERFYPAEAFARRYDPQVWLPRLVICHNPFASIPLPLGFAGIHDEQYGPVMTSLTQGEWCQVASGRSCQQVVTTV